MLNVTFSQANLTNSVRQDVVYKVFEKQRYCNLATERSTATYDSMYDSPDKDYLVDGFGKKLRVTTASTVTPSGRLI